MIHPLPAPEPGTKYREYGTGKIFEVYSSRGDTIIFKDEKGRLSCISKEMFRMNPGMVRIS